MLINAKCLKEIKWNDNVCQHQELKTGDGWWQHSSQNVSPTCQNELSSTHLCTPGWQGTEKMLQNCWKQEEMKSQRIQRGASFLPSLHDIRSWKTSRKKDRSSFPHRHSGFYRVTQHRSDGVIIRVSPQKSSCQGPCLQPLPPPLFSPLNPVNENCRVYAVRQVTCRPAALRDVSLHQQGCWAPPTISVRVLL